VPICFAPAKQCCLGRSGVSPTFFALKITYRTIGIHDDTGGREVATHMATINIHLSERPKFGSSIDSLTGEYEIGVEVPNEIKLMEWKSEILGQMMHYICGRAMPP
jgi:hypothetical protein